MNLIKSTLLPALLLLYNKSFLYANMANPIITGQYGTSAFISRYVEIVMEDIHISVSNDIQNAFVKINYLIDCKKSGKQVPMLFLAYNFRSNFTIKVDEKPIELLDVPESFYIPDTNNFYGFYYLYKPEELTGEPKAIVKWSDYEDYEIMNLHDMKYFELSLDSGMHKIEVTYWTSASIDRNDWINEYIFKYSLSPAKYWSKVGIISVTLTIANDKTHVITNLGEPAEGTLPYQAKWVFSGVPQDYINIEIHPKPNFWANILIKISPFYLSLILGLIFSSIHYIAFIKYRKEYLNKKFNTVMIGGSFLIPFITIIAYMAFFPLIDYVIGIHASKYHGYTFLSMFFYFIITPVYLLIAWIVDRLTKKKFLITKI
ncbi:MAG: hypothetical protein N2167_02170 [Flavobacteriales bacterium]|nr:hypothetical protein [Flavobacteriales bacterium]